MHSQKTEACTRKKKQKFALAKTEACTRKKKHNAVFTLKHAHTYANNAENTLLNTHKGHIFKKNPCICLLNSEKSNNFAVDFVLSHNYMQFVSYSRAQKKMCK